MMGQVRSLADAAELVKKTMDTGPIRVASDCAGLGSEIIALALLGLLMFAAKIGKCVLVRN